MGDISRHEADGPQQEQSRREIIWAQKEQEIGRIHNIEAGSIKIVTALNVSEIQTSQSCEGHMYENETGINSPFVEISAKDQPQNRFVGQEKIIPKVAKKYGISEEDTRTMLLHSMPYEEFKNSKETQAYKKWRKENRKIVDRTESLLRDFYKNNNTSEHIRLILKEQNAGQFEMTNTGREQDMPVRGEEKDLTLEQKAELREQLAQYQREMDNFAEFLKNRQ